MKALTVWQPWASLIAIGAKPYEFRGWPAPKFIIGRRIAIHAGARAMKREEVAGLLRDLQSERAWTTCLRVDLATALLRALMAAPEKAPLSSLVCTAVVGPPLIGWKIAEEFGAALNDSDRAAHSNFGWPMGEVRALEPIIPMKGMQGLWDVPKGVEGL